MNSALTVQRFRRAALHTALHSSLLAAVLLPASVQAQDDDIPVIIVREIMPTNLANTPGAAARLEAEQLAAWRPYTLHDALKFVPGLRTIDDDVLGRRSAIGVRGAPSRRSRKTLLLEDGTPINFSTYLDPSSHYTPPMERLETVDVLKGAGHLQYGPLNNHGIVNFRNKRATATPETNVELAVGNLDTFKRHIMHRRTEGDLGLVLSYTGANADGAFDLEGFRYDDFYASAEWTPGERHVLNTSFTWFRERSSYDESNLTPQEYAVAPRRKLGRFGQEYNTFALDYMKFDLSHDWRLGETLTLSTRFFATNADRPRFTVEPDEIDVGALPAIVLEDPDMEFIPGVQGEMISRDRHYRTAGLESRLRAQLGQHGGWDHTLEWGLRFERHFLDDQRHSGNPGEILKESHRGLLTRDEAYQATALSGFVENSMRKGDWLVSLGARAEEYNVNKVRQSIPASPGPHGPRQEDSNFLLLPSISVLYDGFGADTQVFANLARGYTPAFARTADSFPLDPETGVNSQLGIRTQLQHGFSVEAAVFYNRIHDTIVQLPYSINDMNIVLNSADSRSYGVDVGARWDSMEINNSGLRLYSMLAWNHTRAEFTEDHLGTPIDGNRVPEVPLRAGSLTLGMTHASGWEASISASHFGDFYTDPLNTVALTLADEDREPVGPGDELEIREPAVLGRVPSYTLYSASLRYTPAGSDWSWWLQGRNLADKLYITDLENGIRPGAERTLTAGMTLRF